MRTVPFTREYREIARYRREYRHFTDTQQFNRPAIQQSTDTADLRNKLVMRYINRTIDHVCSSAS